MLNIPQWLGFASPAWLRESIAERNMPVVEIGDVNAQLTFSGGYAYGIAGDTEGLRSLLHVADDNLLKAKREGKSRIVGGPIDPDEFDTGSNENSGTEPHDRLTRHGYMRREGDD